MSVHRRTFEAKSHPAGSPERARLNGDARTSEYGTSKRYVSAGRFPHGGGWSGTFRTRREAVAFEARRLTTPA